MPPKKKPNEPSKKTDAKKKDKIIEDKTFGLKNKKGTKQQKFCKMVATQVQYGDQKKTKTDLLEKQKLAKKDDKKKQAEELNALFKPVEQKVGKGVDPKSVVCAFFKQGLCTKGDKCKFSHDLNIGRKGEKRSIYDDQRDEGGEDNMEQWDEQKLEDVINTKHGETNQAMPPTAIICKYFLDAVENNKYGWFWECPNGEKCHYRHALPPGFQLKKDKKKEDKVEQISLEALIESERAALSSKNLTRVTLETFLKWKQRKKLEKSEKFVADNEKKKADYKAGRGLGISGRLMFEFNPDLVEGDDEEAGEVDYNYREEEEEMNGTTEGEDYDGPVKEITLESLASQAQEADGSGSVRKQQPAASSTSSSSRLPNASTDEDGKMDEAAALPPDPGADAAAMAAREAAIATAMAATNDGDILTDTPIDENLFDGEDLDIVEEELETLDLED